MFISAATFSLVYKLAIIGAAGLATVLWFVILTVDRLNVRLADLEARLADRGVALPTTPLRAHPAHAVSDRFLSRQGRVDVGTYRS